MAHKIKHAVSGETSVMLSGLESDLVAQVLHNYYDKLPENEPAKPMIWNMVQLFDNGTESGDYQIARS